MKWLWEGSEGGPSGGNVWYKPTHSFRDKTYHSTERAKEINMLEGLRKTINKCANY